MAEEPIHEVPVDDIKDTAKTGLNVRRTDRDADVEELAKSIESRGLLQPILVRGEWGKPPYDLIAGHRRLAAHKLLKKKLIKARFKPPAYGDLEAKLDSLVENLHRVELNHADTAEAITFMFKKCGGDARKVARELSLPLATVRDYITIEEQASDYAKQLLRENKVKKADVKRAIVAAQGDVRKADQLLERFPDLYGHEKKRAVEYARQHPQASASTIVEEGKRARQTKTVVLDIDPDVDVALDQAEKRLYMNREEIASKALKEWLIGNGFLARVK